MLAPTATSAPVARGSAIITRFSAVTSGIRGYDETGRNPASCLGFRPFRATGATGLEPATPGFGDRCATSCATPLGCETECSRGEGR